jgi:hypothetical protein
MPQINAVDIFEYNLELVVIQIHWQFPRAPQLRDVSI